MPVPIDAQVPYSEAAHIRVDAHRDEAAWAGAWRVPDALIAFQPTPNVPPTGATEIWITSDADAVYVYAVAHDPEPARIRGSLGRRDTCFEDDWFGLYLDPFGTAQRGYLFVVNPVGVVGDGTVVANVSEDASWDGAWSSDARRTDEGYEVEIAVPWRTVRHPRQSDALGFLFLRHISRLGEKSAWPRLDLNVSGALVQEGVLRGPGELPRDVGLEILPELTFAWTDEGPGQRAFGAYGFTPGATVRFRPSPSVSLLGTFNPDFSQVESDASVVSVNQRNALYFQEKRPFFLDGQEWFSHPLDQLVYTRTMAEPYGGARFTIEPPKATIAGLYVLDAAPTPSVSEGGGWTEEQIGDHPASEAVVRARRDLGTDGQVGLLFSDREILGTGLANRVASADVRARFNGGTTGSASAAVSHTTFADRPAAWAPAGTANLSYDSQHAFAGGWAELVHPDFRAENGYLPRQDRMGGGAWAGYVWMTKNPTVPRGMIGPVELYSTWTFEREPRDLGVNLFNDVNFGNGTNFSVGGTWGGERWLDEWLLRRTAYASLGGRWARWLEATATAEGGVAPYYDPAEPRSGRSVSTSGLLRFRPVPALTIGTSATWIRFTELDGTELFEGWVARARGEVFLSRRVFGRAIVDTSTFERRWTGELLLGWERTPGTAIYLGGSETWSDDPHWTLFAKASGVFGPA